jgi:hypothetical protein
MLALTTLAGFLCSFALLHLGAAGMGLRYAVSVLVAYAVFLAQLRVWVALVRRRHRGRSGHVDPLDALDAVDVRLPARWVGGGGRFAGGGASGSFDASAQGIAPVVSDAASDAGGSAHGGWGLGLDFDADGWPLLAAIVAAVLLASGLIAMGYVVYTAPALLAELLFDGVVAGVLYRRLRRAGEPAWWHGALSRTWVSAFVVLLFFGIGGRVLEVVVPGARSIGDALRFIAG